MEERIFIGRTSAYYEPNEDSLYVEDTWTWSEDENDKDFAGEIYELDEDGAKELEWWLQCTRMNQYERNHSFNPDLRNQEQVWDSLVTQATRIKMYDDWYEVNQVDATETEIEQDFLMDKAEYYRSLRYHSGANELFVKAERWQELADELRSIYDEKFKD